MQNHLANLTNDGQAVALTTLEGFYPVAIGDVSTPEKLLVTIKRLSSLSWITTSHIRELIEEVELSTVTRGIV